MGQQLHCGSINTRLRRARTSKKLLLFRQANAIRVVAMSCKEFPLLMSAQVDGHATEREQAKLQQHLRACAACRRYAADLRRLRADLALSEAPKPPLGNGPDLTLQIQAALQRETRIHGNPVQRRQDLIDLWLMRLVAQGIGTAVSLVLFVFVVTAVFRPAYRTLLASVPEPQVVTADDPVDPAIRYRVLILQPPPPPAFNPHEALLQLGQNLPEDSEIIATVRVNGKNGRARLGQLLEQSGLLNAGNDPTLLSRFSTVLYQQASFQPLRRNEFTSPNAVIVFGKMNISAHLD